MAKKTMAALVMLAVCWGVGQIGYMRGHRLGEYQALAWSNNNYLGISIDTLGLGPTGPGLFVLSEPDADSLWRYVDAQFYAMKVRTAQIERRALRRIP